MDDEAFCLLRHSRIYRTRFVRVVLKIPFQEAHTLNSELRHRQYRQGPTDFLQEIKPEISTNPGNAGNSLKEAP